MREVVFLCYGSFSHKDRIEAFSNGEPHQLALSSRASTLPDVLDVENWRTSKSQLRTSCAVYI